MPAIENAATGEELLCELFAAADDSVDCSIMHEPTRGVEVDDLPSKWPVGGCEANSAQLVCGHVFHPAALALSFLVGDMRCPVCRAGPLGRMLLESVPAAIRPAYAAKIERVASAAHTPEEIEQLRADITHVLANLEVGLLVLGADNEATRASARTRVVFQPGDVDAIEQQVLRAQAGGAGTQGAGTLASTLASTLTRESASTFGMHRSFQRLARAVVGRQVCHNAAGRVRFALVHPLVPVPISSRDMSVAEAWHEFFNAPGADSEGADSESAASEPGAGGEPGGPSEPGGPGEPSEPRPPDAQPRPIPLFCAAVASTHPVGFVHAHFAGAAAAPELTTELNTLMLVNIAAYVRQVLESIRDAVETHTDFDAPMEVEITAQAVNGLQFQL